MTVTWKEVADMIYPDVAHDIAYYEKQYTKRPVGQIVSRIAPSPT